MILRIDNTAQFEFALQSAVELLRAGRPVAIPTETVYGLAANALDPRAVAEVFRMKKRPAANPLIVHVSGSAMARDCARHWPAIADKLAAEFWPGPLTLVVQRSSIVPDIVTAAGPTVGLRFPAHPFAEALIRECGFPLAAPSANRSMEVSPTTAAHVAESLGDDVPLIIDAGPARIGIESTVLDVSESPPRVLRPGMIHIDQLRRSIGDVIFGGADESNLRSPGLLRKHYAPRARLVIWRWQDATELLAKTRELGVPLNAIHILIRQDSGPLMGSFGRIECLPEEPEAFARSLYSELRKSDAAGARVIVVEAPPETPEWTAIWDRLTRASTSGPDGSAP